MTTWAAFAFLAAFYAVAATAIAARLIVEAAITRHDIRQPPPSPGVEASDRPQGVDRPHDGPGGGTLVHPGRRLHV